MLDELEWYKAMSIDTRDCVQVYNANGFVVVPYDTIESAYKCCRHSRHNAQWRNLRNSIVRGVDVAQDVRGYMRITLFIA